MHADTIAPEAACTSTQFHLQVSPQDYAAHWNAAQCIAGVQLALGANSPFLFGKELWRETRIALFEQATDTRPLELKAQGVRPRVWFGERWITSIFDHFEENVRYFPSLLPVCEEEDPVDVLDRGDIPQLAELRMHNGTVYRWNRPVYDVLRGRPHLRVENRVLPAGPTIVDVFANGAFYYGLLRTLAAQDRPVWSQMSFAAAEENFEEGARQRHQRPALLAGPRRRAGHRARAAAAAADGPRRAWPSGASTPRSSTGCWASSSGGAPPTATGRSGRPRRSTGSTSSGSRWTAATRCARCCAATSSSCTPTSRSPTGPSTSERGRPGAAARSAPTPRIPLRSGAAHSVGNAAASGR